MAIEFTCSSCEKSYRVKEELAGKTADCTACGAKIEIPMLVSAASESDLNIKSDINLNKISDLIDDELPTEESATLTPAVTTSCSECGAPIAVDAVLCVACGYDKRLGDVIETESEAQIEEGEESTTTDHLKRGGAFSFLGAIIGASLWFALGAFFELGVQVGYPALLVGILAGLGMKRYGGNHPGVMGGLISSVMALAGVFAAKALIYDHYRRSFEIEGKAGKSVGEVVPDSVQLDNMLGMFQWYDILIIPITMCIAFALTQNNESTGPEMV